LKVFIPNDSFMLWSTFGTVLLTSLYIDTGK
jgi:hypothetical protein